MSESRLNLSVGINGETSPRDARRPWKKKMDLEMARRLIEAKDYSDDLKAALIKKLKTYPCDTYEQFLKNIGRHINDIQRQGNN